MKKLCTIILILLTVNLYSQTNDTLTLWTEVENYSLLKDTVMNNFKGLGELASVSLVRISDQNMREYRNYTCISVSLSTFPKEVNRQQYYVFDSTRSGSSEWWGPTGDKISWLYLRTDDISRSISGRIFFSLPGGSYLIRHKIEDFYYIIRTVPPSHFDRDTTLDAPELDPSEREEEDTTSWRGSDKSSLKEFRILIAFTPAASEYLTNSLSGPQYDNMNLYVNDYLISTLKSAFSNSAISLNPVLACSFVLEGFTESADPSSDLGPFFQNATVRKYRDVYSADVCFLIERNSTTLSPGASFSLSDRTRASNAPFAYAVSECIKAYEQFTFCHEAGHLFGADHDRTNTPVNPLFSYGYGFVHSGPDFNTIMAYGNSRINYFSNPDVSYLNIPTGECGKSNNTRVFDESYGMVNIYRETQLLAEVDNSTKIILESNSPLHSFKKNSYGDLVAGQLIKLKEGFIAQEGCEFKARIGPCKYIGTIPPSGSKRTVNSPGNFNTENNELEAVRIYPNPFNNIIHFENIPNNSDIFIYSVYGNLVNSTKNCSNELNLNVSTLITGTYFVKIVNEVGTRNFKLIKSF